MTFSFRPCSVSVLPATAASVRTRVVSWNEAAEMKDGVCSEALVMPSRTGVAGSRLLALLLQALVQLRELDPVDMVARDVAAVAGLDDLDLLQHLADDHLDVLVVDQHALQPVDLLDLVDEIGGQRLDAPDGQDVVRCRIAVEDVVALLDDVAFLEMERLALRDQVLDRLDADPRAAR